MPLKELANHEFMRGSTTRSIVDLNVLAVTTSLDGGEKRKPGRILNVYVVPPAVGTGIASATSGMMRDPSGPGLSGYLTRFAQQLVVVPDPGGWVEGGEVGPRRQACTVFRR